MDTIPNGRKLTSLKIILAVALLLFAAGGVWAVSRAEVQHNRARIERLEARSERRDRVINRMDKRQAVILTMQEVLLTKVKALEKR